MTIDPGEQPYGTDPEFLYRRDDPITSMAAAYKTDTVRFERFVHEKLRETGFVGIPMDVLVQRYKGIFPYSSLTARRAALIRKRLITAGPDRRGTVAGSTAHVCRSAEFSTPEQKLYSWGPIFCADGEEDEDADD